MKLSAFPAKDSGGGFPWRWLLLLWLFRSVLSAVLPMTGDEAYFVLWGEHPAGGYYDHPPMVGWWLSGLLLVSREAWVLRLPALLLPLVLAWGGWWLVRPMGEGRARWAALLVLLQPVNVWNVLITTDTPVILFSMLSLLAYVAALRTDAGALRQRLLWQAAAGALLGLAFLGKYFAALLGIACFVHVLAVRRDAGRWAGFAVLFLAALPAPLYTLWWNSQHCWVNILFNFINRQGVAGVSWENPVLYVLSVAYLATPWGLLALWRNRAALRAVLAGNRELAAAGWLMGVPLALFALMSLARPVGLHWLVAFMPLFAVLAAAGLPEAVLARLLKWSAGFALGHGVLFAAIVLLPFQVWKDTRVYEGMALRAQTPAVLAALDPYRKDYLWAMESYSSAAFLAYSAARPVAVFGGGSLYARQDDFLTDWRTQDGRNILILRTRAPDREAYRPYFERVDLHTLDIAGKKYYLVAGQGFDYAVYHERVLTRVRQRYYRIPDWLPKRGCEFCERYFPEGR